MAHEDAKWSDAGETFTRISALPLLSRCPGFMVISMAEDRPSKAAHTGSMVGRIIQLWHDLGEDLVAYGAAREQATREVATTFPMADIEEALRVSLLYTCDNRNYGTVVKGTCEKEVRLVLDPAPEDPTGEPIRLLGHLDQGRKAGGQRWVWDIKNGAQPALDILYAYAWQLAAYALAATETYGEPWLPGGIIRLQGYGAKCDPKQAHEAPIFVPARWSLDQCRGMMGSVRQHFAWLRMGLIHQQPGPHCGWCPGEGPHLCGDRIAELYPQGVSV